MPFKSKQQSRWMFANMPDKAKEFASHTDYENLPEKKHKKKSKKEVLEYISKLK